MLNRPVPYLHLRLVVTLMFLVFVAYVMVLLLMFYGDL
jgi:hypothetical protein